jgi:hypothetical protein
MDCEAHDDGYSFKSGLVLVVQLPFESGHSLSVDKLLVVEVERTATSIPRVFSGVERTGSCSRGVTTPQPSREAHERREFRQRSEEFDLERSGFGA